MQVILKNLLENAVRHSQQDRVKIRIHTADEANGIFIVFRDNGHGFHGNSKFLGKLFEKGESSQGARTWPLSRSNSHEANGRVRPIRRVRR